VHERVLLDWAAGLVLLAVAILCNCAASWCGRGDVGNLFGIGVLTADLGNADVSCLAGLGEGVIAAVEVLALLGTVSM
jgi:hypothetical protein